MTPGWDRVGYVVAGLSGALVALLTAWRWTHTTDEVDRAMWCRRCRPVPLDPFDHS